LDIDIVVGTHGRTGFDRYVLGSVTEYFVRPSSIPVLAVQRHNPETGHIEPSLRGSDRPGERHDGILDTTGNSPTK
jgi:hypothetical protein